jgi:hypothetical protein
MSEKHAYEAYGIRPGDGASFTVEILGERAQDEAVKLAGHYAELRKAAVDIYRVPFTKIELDLMGGQRDRIYLPGPAEGGGIARST